MYAFKHQISHQTFSSTSETFNYTIHSHTASPYGIAIRHNHTAQPYGIAIHWRNFSVLTAKLIVLPRLMVVKLLKWIKNLVFSTFDPRPRLLTLDFWPSTFDPRLLTLDFWPSTFDPRLLTLDFWPSTSTFDSRPRLSTLDLWLSTLDPRPSTLDPRPSTYDPRPMTLDPRPLPKLQSIYPLERYLKR